MVLSRAIVEWNWHATSPRRVPLLNLENRGGFNDFLRFYFYFFNRDCGRRFARVMNRLPIIMFASVTL